MMRHEGGLRLPELRLAGALVLGASLGGLTACASGPLPADPPRLRELEEPLALRAEPDDEADRVQLAPGGFTGLVVAESARALDAGALGGPGSPGGLPVAEVVANSPAQAAGVRVGDLLLAVGEGGDEQVLEWASEWRDVELAAGAGSKLQLVLDRAGREYSAELEVQARLAPGTRLDTQRFRETDRVGLVVRTATEVESRAADLAPGAGAVVVGLAAGSPWRRAEDGGRGLVFGDVIRAVDGETLGHPQLLLDAVRAAETEQRLELEVLRDGQRLRLALPVSRRARELKSVRVPLLFDYEKQVESSRTSLLLGLIRVRRTRAAWDVRLLWLVSFGGGDADRLEEVRE